MSLKAFHVAFVAISTLGAIAFALWCLRHAPAAGSAYYAMGAASALLAVALVVYGVWFLKKMKNVSYL